MRAKAKAIVIATLLSATLQFAPAKAEPDIVADRCNALASIDPDKLLQALTTYAGKVMGKEPEHWTDVDYANLAANAMSCHGQPANLVNKVNGEIWALKLTDARNTNAEINLRSQAIVAAYTKFWKNEDEFPACSTFLRWKRDDVWYTNNSEELFGKPFMEMSKEDLSFFKRIVQECQPVMGSILDRWRRHPSTAEGIVNSVMSSIDMDAEAINEKKLAIPERLLVRYDGRRIPISYLRPTTQKVVMRVITLENKNRIMPTNSLIQFSHWANQVEAEDKDGPDLMYARAVKDIVADHMFKAADQIRSFGRASAGPTSSGQ